MSSNTDIRGRAAATLDENIVEAWGQGFMVAGSVMLIFFTVSNMKHNVLLHKLILIELCMLILHGTFIFLKDPVYGWYLSATAVPLYCSWFLHNAISWLKIRPFLSRWGSRVFIVTVLLTAPFWTCEAVFNFFWFNNLGFNAFHKTRPYETFFRDPWWLFTTFYLIWVIKRDYDVGFRELITTSPRFGVLMSSMFLAVSFSLCDIVITFKGIGGVDGINPYWKLSAIFKCAADVLFLDDFKKVLDSLVQHTINRDFSSATASLHNVTTMGTARSDLLPSPNTPSFGAGGGLSSNELSALHPVNPADSVHTHKRGRSRPNSGISLTHSGPKSPTLDDGSIKTAGTSRRNEPSRVDWFDIVGEEDVMDDCEKNDAHHKEHAGA